MKRSIFDKFNFNFVKTHDPNPQGAPVAAPVQLQPILLQMPGQAAPAPALAPGESALDKMQKTVEAMAKELQELKTAQAPKTKKPKEGDELDPMAQFVVQQKQFMDQQAAWQAQQIADAQAQQLKINLESLMTQLTQQSNGQFDPAYLDMTSVERFQASVPRALQAYTATQQHFFNEFMKQMKQQNQALSVQALTNPGMQQQQINSQLFNNMPAQGNGVQGLQQPTNAAGVPQAASWIHPMTDGGRSYAAVRQGLMNGNLLPTAPLQTQQLMNPNLNPMNLMQGQQPRSPQQAQFQQQQQIFDQNQFNQQQQFNPNQNQFNQQQMMQQQQPQVPVPVPDARMTGGNSMAQLTQQQLQAAQQGALDSINAKRNGRLTAAASPSWQGVSLNSAMRAPVHGGGAANNMSLSDLVNKAQADSRTPQGLSN